MTAHSEYVKISAGDPGGTIESAFSAMNARTVFIEKPADERMINERGVFKVLGVAKGEALMQWIEAQPIEMVPARVKTWFKPSEQGVDVLDSSAQAIFYAAEVGGIISATDNAKLSEYGRDEVPEYPGLTEIKIQNARDIKAKGLL